MERHRAAADAYRMHPLTLRFRGAAIEREYQDHHYGQWRRPGQVAGLLGAGLLAVGAVVDPLITAGRPEWLPVVRAMRLALIALCLAITWVSRTRYHRRATAPLSAGAHVLTALFIAILIAVEGTPRYVGGGLAAVLVVLLYAHALSRMPLGHGFAASAGAVAAFLAATAVFVRLSPDLWIVYGLELVTGWAAAAAGCLI
ncbi:MAG TPA: hypothetical protein VFX49_15845, partial [Chloroflexota bacterium]|nr:hypothetical protein [Chloroflexota bacterium]